MNRIRLQMLTTLAALLCSLCLVSTSIAIPIEGLYNTGVDDNGIPLANSAASIDTHYTISPNPDLGSDGLTHVEDETAFPVGSAWLANTATSKWIAPRFDTAGSAGGLFSYNLSFNLGYVDLTSATISGDWAVDDGTVDAPSFGVFLNGVKVALSNSAGYSSFTSFTIPTGSPFVSGENVLSFRFNNGGSYTGLMVNNLNGSVTALAPEPSSLLLLGFGTLLVARRKRKAQA